MPTAYHIRNVRTGAYAALFSDADGVDIVNMTLNLDDNANRGAEVEIVSSSIWYLLFNGIVVAHITSRAGRVQTPEFELQIFCGIP